MGFITFLQHRWSAFRQNNQYQMVRQTVSDYSKPDRVGLSYNVDRTIVSSIYNRIAVDAAAVSIIHARLNENGQFVDTINDKLNERFNGMANKDQTGRDLVKDIIISLCGEGTVALVPTHTDVDPKTGAWTIDALRVAKIIEWRPNDVVVNCYNEDTGHKEDIVVPKATTAIMDNPFYEIMNCPNSSLKRLISKLNLLDKLDNDAGSGKLDIIIQLPYAVRNDIKRKEAESRRKDIEMQLVGSKYGIAYIDATEHITQLNRPAENNLVAQIESLTATVYGQIGLSEAIMNGTASEQEMINYYNATIEPFLACIKNAVEQKFLTKTARTQGQGMYYYRDPFKLIPAEKIAEIADKLTRNEILSPNEIRSIIGFRPSSDPKSDELRNRNINQDSESANKNQNGVPTGKEGSDVRNRRKESETNS